MSRKVLILGAAFEQLPAIKRAKELGYSVAVADFDPNAIGIPYADKYYNCSTIDPQGVYEAAKDFCADGIFLIATDKPVKAFAYATTKLGLPGYTPEIARQVTDKGVMAQVLKAHDVAMPWFYIAHDLNELKQLSKSITFPCIMKPVNNSASRGVIKISSIQELEEAYNYSSKNCSEGQSVIIEEYMQGPEVSVETLIIDGEPIVVQVTDKLTTGAPHFVEMGHSQPSRLPQETIECIKCVAQKAVIALGLQNSTAHVEIIVTAEGPKIVEVGGRLGGDGITAHLVKLSSHIDMLEVSLNLMTGGKPVIHREQELGSAIRFITADKSGVLKGLNNTEEARRISGIQEVYMSRFVGEQVSCNGIQSSDDRVGHIIAQGVDAQDAVEKCEAALRMVSVEVSCEC